jgi:hypothetical protein
MAASLASSMPNSFAMASAVAATAASNGDHSADAGGRGGDPAAADDAMTPTGPEGNYREASSPGDLG